MDDCVYTWSTCYMYTSTQQAPKVRIQGWIPAVEDYYLPHQYFVHPSLALVPQTYEQITAISRIPVPVHLPSLPPTFGTSYPTLGYFIPSPPTDPRGSLHPMLLCAIVFVSHSQLLPYTCQSQPATLIKNSGQKYHHCLFHHLFFSEKGYIQYYYCI